MLYVLDSSSILWAWDTMPAEKRAFADFWTWIGEELQKKHLCISETAFDEVENKAPECNEFLKDNDIQISPVTGQIVKIASKIKKDLGIENDQYSTQGGVGENDLLIIAHAYRLHQDGQEVTLLSNEKEQPDLPDSLKNFKIPAVCSKILKPSVPCLNFRVYMGKEMPNNNE